MATAGPNSPGTAANDSSVGTVAWTTVDNCKVEDLNYANFSVGIGTTFVDSTVKLVKGGTVSGDNKSTGAAVPSTEAYRTFGGTSDLWGLSLSSSDVNASDFGVVYSGLSSAPSTSNYLKATNFGFSVPSGATINGITVEIKYLYAAVRRISVNHIRITVTYTESSASAVPVIMNQYRLRL